MITFVTGVLLGGLASWFVTHLYYVKASKEQRLELDKLKEQIRPRTSLLDFEDYLSSSSWTRTTIDNCETWIADDNSTFQIKIGDRERGFKEKWTSVFPDPSSSAYPVYLKIGDSVVKEIAFISMDGGRIFVPMATIHQTSKAELQYYWKRSSIEMRVNKIIGTYDTYSSIDKIAHACGIEIVE